MQGSFFYEFIFVAEQRHVGTTLFGHQHGHKVARIYSPGFPVLALDSIDNLRSFLILIDRELVAFTHGFRALLLEEKSAGIAVL